jgi:alkaline phosphatase
MPRGRSTFNKRQKEQARQQKQRDKTERKTQRRQDQPEGVTVVDEEEELRQMREHAAEQAALFGLGSDDDPDSSDLLPPRKQVDR